MRVVYFYSKLFREAWEALPPDAEMALCEGPNGYWERILERWTGKDDLLFVEQDNVLHDQVLPQLADCPGDWCCFGYEYTPSRPSLLDQSLGCTRFSARLQQAVQLDPAPREWPFAEAAIVHPALAAGFTPCKHTPLVRHLHPDPAG